MLGLPVTRDDHTVRCTSASAAASTSTSATGQEAHTMYILIAVAAVLMFFGSIGYVKGKPTVEKHLKRLAGRSNLP